MWGVFCRAETKSAISYRIDKALAKVMSNGDI